MNKRKLHHLWVQLRKVSLWYFLILAIISFVIAVFALRQNNLTALHLRDQVLATDKANGEVETALNKLRLYTYSHMNTDLATEGGIYPPIQLKYRYDRLVKAEKDRVSSANSQIYNDAQHYCEQRNSVDFSGHNRVPCVQQYVTTHGVKEQVIPDDLYKFDFASPLWSADVAGWFLVLAGFFGLLFIVQFILELWLRHQVKSRN